ncbi:MAG: ASKHA domain-containing protein [Candidatus Brocadiales bacterium]
MSKENHTFKIRFLPNDKTIETEPGTTVLEAAHTADVYISSLCGGVATCGKCKVVIEEGEVESPPTPLLSEDEVANKYVLACQARVKSDLLVSIPPETRIEVGQILIAEEEKRAVTPGMIPAILPGLEYRHDPLVKKLYLELDPPTMDNNLADYERLLRAVMLEEGVGMESLQADIDLIRQMPSILRKSDWKLTATVAEHGTMREVIQLEPGDTTKNHFGAAIDVGTTTVVVQLVDLSTHRTLDSEAAYNSQMKWGEDYIQRIIYATEKGTFNEMQKTIVNDINELISTLTLRNGLRPEDIGVVCCSGNTAMMHFLLNLDSTLLRKEPYIPTANSVPRLKAKQLGIDISERGLVYLLPGVAAYVGGDITGGAAAIGLDKRGAVSLFIDIGTNGEVALGSTDWLVCCSSSAGPAFEGSGVRHGMRAANGAIERLQISEDFSVRYKVIGNLKPRGICGSGLLDTIAALLRSGAVSKSGKLVKGSTPRVRETEEGNEFLLVEGKETATGTDIVITQADIENLIRSKAAVYAAASTLVDSMDLSIADIETVYLAGGFGSYLDIDNTITIGMLPEMPPHKICFVGNSSLAGARLSLLSKEAFGRVKEIASKMTYFDLMGNPAFMDKFMSANFLPHTNPDEFPCVYRTLAEGTKTKD